MNDKIIIVTDISRKIEITDAQRTQISNYFKRIKPSAFAHGFEVDKITKKRIIAPMAFFHDDNFCWNSELVYHFEKYGFIPTNDFLEKTFGWTVE